MTSRDSWLGVCSKTQSTSVDRRRHRATRADRPSSVVRPRDGTRRDRDRDRDAFGIHRARERERERFDRVGFDWIFNDWRTNERATDGWCDDADAMPARRESSSSSSRSFRS